MLKQIWLKTKLLRHFPSHALDPRLHLRSGPVQTDSHFSRQKVLSHPCPWHVSQMRNQNFPSSLLKSLASLSTVKTRHEQKTFNIWFFFLHQLKNILRRFVFATKAKRENWQSAQLIPSRHVSCLSSLLQLSEHCQNHPKSLPSRRPDLDKAQRKIWLHNLSFSHELWENCFGRLEQTISLASIKVVFSNTKLFFSHCKISTENMEKMLLSGFRLNICTMFAKININSKLHNRPGQEKLKQFFPLKRAHQMRRNNSNPSFTRVIVLVRPGLCVCKTNDYCLVESITQKLTFGAHKFSDRELWSESIFQRFIGRFYCKLCVRDLN